MTESIKKSPEIKRNIDEDKKIFETAENIIEEVLNAKNNAELGYSPESINERVLKILYKLLEAEIIVSKVNKLTEEMYVEYHTNLDKHNIVYSEIYEKDNDKMPSSVWFIFSEQQTTKTTPEIL